MLLIFLASLPQVIADLHEDPSVQDALRLQGVEYEMRALQSVYSSYPALPGTHSHGSDVGGQLGATGQLAWQGDLPLMQE